MILFLFACVAFVCAYYIRSRQCYWSCRNVAGPRPVPLCGNMLSYLQQKQHYGEVYHDIYKSYPELAYVGVYKVMDQPAVLLRDVDLIKDVLTTNFHCFKDNDFVVDEKIDPLMSQNPFAAREHNWKIARSNMAPLFTPMKIKNILPVIQTICKQLTSFIEENPHTNVDASKLCSKYTLEVVASCGLGVQAESFSNENSPFVTMTKNIYSHGSLLQTTAVLFLPIISKIFRLSYIPTKVNTWMRSMVGDIMKMRETCVEQRVDLLQSLIDQKNKRNDITDNMITGYCLTMILEGFETSSSLMTYCLFELASNPDMQRVAQLEIDQALNRANGQITDEFIQELNYLDGVCYEIMRLYAPMLVLTKVCNQRYELPPQNQNITNNTPVFVEPGTVIVIPVHSIHRDPMHYENPERFDPYRFMGDNKIQRNKFTYLSFGEGHRLCIGMKLAFAQSKAGIAAILSKYNVELSAKQTLPLKTAKSSFLLSCENGIWLNFSKRKD